MKATKHRESILGGTGVARRPLLAGTIRHMNVALALALAVASATTVTPATAGADGGGKASIEGVWRVTRHGVNCATNQEVSSFPAIMSFGKHGSYTGHAVPPGSTPANGSPEYGRWMREAGARNYSFAILSYSYDGGGAFSGSTEIGADLALSNDGDSFGYEATIRFLDANGALLATVCGRATGTRF